MHFQYLSPLICTNIPAHSYGPLTLGTNLPAVGRIKRSGQRRLPLGSPLHHPPVPIFSCRTHPTTASTSETEMECFTAGVTLLFIFGLLSRGVVATSNANECQSSNFPMCGAANSSRRRCAHSNHSKHTIHGYDQCCEIG